MKYALVLALLISVAAHPAAYAAPVVMVSADTPTPMSSGPTTFSQLDLAASYSCTPRKTCTKIRSCDEAVWYFRNCSWGGRLDGDNDGIPCESLCR